MEWCAGPGAEQREKLRRAAEETGQHIPMLDDEPELYPHLRWIWNFWREIHLWRPYNEAGLQPSRPEDLLTLARAMGVCHNEDIRELFFYIPRLDEKLIQLSNEERKKKVEQSKKKK